MYVIRLIGGKHDWYVSRRKSGNETRDLYFAKWFPSVKAAEQWAASNLQGVCYVVE